MIDSDMNTIFDFELLLLLFIRFFNKEFKSNILFLLLIILAL